MARSKKAPEAQAQIPHVPPSSGAGSAQRATGEVPLLPLPTSNASLEPASKSPRSRPGRIRIPLSGLINLTALELQLIDTQAMQRLRKVRQLGGTYIVYPGATHTRFEHSLGALDMAEKMLDALERNHVLSNPTTVTVEDRELVRLAALVHDIGHLPYGHTLEDEVGIFIKHDDPRILSLLFSKESEVGHALGPKRDQIIKILAKDAESRLSPDKVFLADLVANTICADLLDYLRRDFHHLGFRSDYDDHIFEYLTLCRDQGGRLRLAINYMRGGKARPDSISMVLQILELRYMLAESVLFHHAKDCHSAMLARALLESCFLQERMPTALGERLASAYQQEPGSQVPLYFETDGRLSGEPLLSLSDDELVAAIAEDSDDCAGSLGRCVRDRQLYNLTLTIRRRDATRTGSQQEIIRVTHESPLEKYQLERQIEEELRLPRGSVIFYTPSADVQHKVAGVHVVVDSTAVPLSQYEIDNHDQLTGGFLRAQLKRFQELWRSYVFTYPGLSADQQRLVKKYVRARFGLNADAATAPARRTAAKEGYAEIGALLLAETYPEVPASRLLTAQNEAVTAERRGEDPNRPLEAAIEAIISSLGSLDDISSH
jgi:hypothetical protein